MKLKIIQYGDRTWPPPTALSRRNGVHITEADYPRGFYVAKYDAAGFTSAPRWFPTIEKAQDYATQIVRAS